MNTLECVAIDPTTHERERQPTRIVVASHPHSFLASLLPHSDNAHEKAPAIIDGCPKSLLCQSLTSDSRMRYRRAIVRPVATPTPTIDD